MSAPDQDNPGGPPGGPQDSLAFLLSKVGVHAGKRFAERLAPLDLHPRDVGLLRAVAGLGHPSQQQLAERLGVTPSRIVGLVDGLERRGLLERRSNPEDRRAYELHLTEAGRSLLAEVGRVSAAHEAELSAGLDGEERRTLVGLLRRLAEAQQLPLDVHPGMAGGPPRRSRESGAGQTSRTDPGTAAGDPGEGAARAVTPDDGRRSEAPDGTDADQGR